MKKRGKTFLFQLFIIFSCATASEIFPVERQLQLQCPPNTIQTFDDPGDLETQESR
jgi:hypothetical protein